MFPKQAPIVETYVLCPGYSVNVENVFTGTKKLHPHANILQNCLKQDELHICSPGII